MYTSVYHLLAQNGVDGVACDTILDELSCRMMTRENIIKLHSNLKPLNVKNENTMKRELRTMLRKGGASSGVPVPMPVSPSTSTSPSLPTSVIPKNSVVTEVSPAIPMPTSIVSRPVTPSVISAFPEDKDQLFWLFYICQNGYDTYTMASRKFQDEKDAKFSLVDTMRPNKRLLKSCKFNLTDIEDDLGNKNTIRLSTFLALCFAHDISVLVMMDKIAYVNPIKSLKLAEDETKATTATKMAIETSTATDTDGDDTEEDSSSQPINWILTVNQSHSAHSKYTLRAVSTLEPLASLVTGKYVISNLLKPMKAMTAYSKEELNAISETLGVATTSSTTVETVTKTEVKKEIKVKPRTKRDIYEDILMVLSLLIPKDY